MNIYDAAKILNISGEIKKEDVKSYYINACKKYHPDLGGSVKMMQMVNAAYSVLKSELKYSFNFKDRGFDYGEVLNKAINAIIFLSGIDIEICGAWLWVSGDTQTHRSIFKTHGFMWSPHKIMWYFRPKDYRSKSNGKSSIDKIRSKYGSQKVPNRSYSRQLTESANS